jgi:glycosyltransferase involved in cell wall biosynthesis
VNASEPSLLWLGALVDHSGHADEARAFLRALEAGGSRPAARHLEWAGEAAPLAPEDEAMLTRQQARVPREPIVAVHGYLPYRKQLNVADCVNVARAMFETDTLPSAWLDPLLERDEVWVPSAFNVETFQRGGVPASRLRVLGATLDFDAYAPGAEPLGLWPDDGRFVFLTNFDFSERKGWRQLLTAWATAFDGDDAVRLVLKTGSFYAAEDEVKARIDGFIQRELGSAAARRLAPLEIVTATLPGPEMPRLYAGADAFVLPSRGEGWGRPYMEAMAMGLPTIGSRFGGSLEFMDDDVTWLVDGELVAVDEDAELFNRLYTGHRWFEPDPDALAAALRDVAGRPEAARERASRARPRLLERFGPEVIAARVLELARDAVERQASLRRPSLCVMRGPFGSNSSLAVVNDGIAGALTERGNHVLLRSARAARVGLDTAGVTGSWPPSFEAATAGPLAVLLPWEYGAPPVEWVEEARSRADRIWVPSEYVRQGFVAGGMPPGIVEVVPHGVDQAAFRPDGPARPLGRDAGCVFLFVGGTIWRKGADILLEGWRRAFGPGDDVLLVIKDFGTGSHYRGQTRGDEIRALATDGTAAPVLYLDEELTARELPALYRAADVLVAPYRGEGFCLPALEAMACGLPVIHTGTGPTREFVPPQGGWALPARRVPLEDPSLLPPLAGEGYVQEVDPEALAEALRAAAGRDERLRRGAAALERARDYTWNRVAAIVEESLATLEAEALPLARGVLPAELDFTRERLVVYAPDWDDEERWAPALSAWARAFGPDDPVTLALHVPGGDAERLGARIAARLEAHGHAEDSLPDLALCRPGGGPLAGLVAAADAVLLDGAERRADLTRRAARLLAADDAAELDAFRRELPPAASHHDTPVPAAA